MVEYLTPVRVKFLGQSIYAFYMHIVGVSRGNPTSVIVEDLKLHVEIIMASS